MKITIATAALDSVRTLPDCLSSVARQRVNDNVLVEHVVRDGGSTDGTVAVLEEWTTGAPNRRYSSEPDGGFYAALNLAVNESDADVVGFLNSDDLYRSDEVLARVVEKFDDPQTQGVYGDLVYVRDARGALSVTRYWRSGTYGPSSFRWGWMPPHPTVFVRRQVFERHGTFRTDFGSAADYEWLVRVMVAGQVPFAYIPHVQVAMRTGGMSNSTVKARVRANRNDRRAWQVNNLTPLPWTFVLKPLRKVPQWWMRPQRGAE